MIFWLGNLIGSLITCSTVKALTPARVHFTGRSPRLLRPTFPSFRLQPRRAPRYRFLPRQRIGLLPGFALESQARRYTTPNQVRHPTDRQFASGCSPPWCAFTRSSAVTLGYGAVANSDTDFHRADLAPSRAHDSRLRGNDSGRHL